MFRRLLVQILLRFRYRNYILSPVDRPGAVFLRYMYMYMRLILNGCLYHWHLEATAGATGGVPGGAPGCALGVALGGAPGVAPGVAPGGALGGATGGAPSWCCSKFCSW